VPDLGKHHKARDVSAALDLAASSEGGLAGFSARLSWSHYRTLTKISHAAERAFYEIQAELGNWSVPQLERQIHTHLFARLLKSRDKAGVLDLAARGQVLERPADAIKHPYVLDFLDLPENAQLRESDLESAILEKLQHFLLEIGKGFAFVARQKRLSFEDEHFYVDLVFYNVILKCYLLIDLKLGKLTHQDVGQMDSYVRLFDEQDRTEGDGPTIGLILCAPRRCRTQRCSRCWWRGRPSGIENAAFVNCSCSSFATGITRPRIYTSSGQDVRDASSDGRKAVQLGTGWRGYFIGRAVHSTKVERSVSIDRW
jgi:predicted nuclease of restriction endonuclease-like (RecB) superfamily